MQTLKSPFDKGPRITRRILSVVGACFAPLLWASYRNSIKKQVTCRGAVPADVWGSKERRDAAKTIEKIINEVCWSEEFTFHPNDPYHVVGDHEIGDLDEAEAIIGVEQMFNIKFDDSEFNTFLESNPTFGQFVDFVIQKVANKALVRTQTTLRSVCAAQLGR